MFDFDEGRLPEAEAELSRLIAGFPPETAGQERRELCDCLTARATVLRYANRWSDALSDLDFAETLTATLTPFGRKAMLTGIYVTRTKLLMREDTGIQNLDRVHNDLARWRALGGDEWMFEETECELARVKRDWSRVAELSARVSDWLKRKGWPVGEAFARLRTANALLELGELDRAEAELRPAHDFFVRLGPPDRLAAAELALARIFAARGQFDVAWSHAEQAIDLGETLIRHFRSMEDQRRFAADKLEAYGYAFDIALGTGGEDGLWRAWSVAERAKSFYLCQLVANSDVKLFDGVPDGSAERLRELDDAIDALDARNQDGNADAENLMRQRNELAGQYSSILAAAMRANPRWGALRVPPALDLPQLLASLPREWSVLSHYWRKTDAGSVLHLFFADENRRPVHRSVAWTDDELRQVESHRQQLEQHDDKPSLLAFPGSLGGNVFPADVVELLPRDTPLLISSHGVLANMSLHAIPLATNQRLIERCPVLMIPTLALLAVSRERQPEREVLLLGCEQDGFKNRSLKDVPAEIEKLTQLWSARGEVSAALIPPDGSPESCGHAPESWSRFRLLHLACHGKFDVANPLDAALFLGRDRLPAAKFFTMRLNASLVVLSACDVGRRSDRADPAAGGFDEWLGMYVPLFYAGARMLLASRWKANSERGARFMSVFHKALADGDSPPVAMRKACLNPRRGPEPFWSNWTLVGLP